MDFMNYVVGGLVLIGVAVVVWGGVSSYRRQKREYLNMGD